MSTALSAPQQLPVQQPQSESVEWKQQLTERLDAYRAKRNQPASVRRSSTQFSAVDSRASSIARVVASRYASAPSYQELLLAAAEAEKAAQAALRESAARAATIAAQDSLQSSAELTQKAVADDGSDTVAQEESLPLLAATQPATAVMPHFAERSRNMRLHQTVQEPEPSLEDLLASAVIEPPTFLPSKLIEFPRELVSLRRARPRLPENPTWEQDPTGLQEQASPQLRIFEVQPESEGITQSEQAGHGSVDSPVLQTELPSYSIHPQTAESPVQMSAQTGNQPTVRSFEGLEWAAISLDKEPSAYRRGAAPEPAEYVPFMVDPASIDRRLMAFAVDFAAVTAGFLGFLLVFVASTPHLPTGLTAMTLAGVVYGALWVLYQMLFFSLSGATAGMLYARIALCTFDNQNPTRPALRRRLAIWWLSCLPLGLGFLWSFVDEDNLCWHDRMTHMYQRGY